MATLTIPQYLYIRQNSGDNEVTHEVDDDAVQDIYDDTAQGNSNLNRTVYYVILRRYGLAAALVSVTTQQTGTSSASNQKFDQLERLLKLWGTITGIGGGVSIGSSATYTYRADSAQTAEPDYTAVDDV